MMIVVTPNNNNRMQLALHRDGSLADCLLTGVSTAGVVGDFAWQRATALCCFDLFDVQKMAQEKRGKAKGKKEGSTETETTNNKDSTPRAASR